MKYSLPFYMDNPYLNKTDEISIKYEAADEPELAAFIDEHPNQRIVLKIAKNHDLTDENFHYLAELFKLYAAGAVVCRFESLTISSAAAALPHFFNFTCRDLEEVMTIAAQGVTDIYIGGNLGYQVKQIRDITSCNIRLYPNLAQSAIDASDPQTKFYIRPEDVEKYEEYIDYLEFYCPSDIRETAQLYKIYAIDHLYNGWLSGIIKGAPKQIHNACVPNVLIDARLKCNKACVYWQTKCKICEKGYELAQTLYAKLHTLTRAKKNEPEE